MISQGSDRGGVPQDAGPQHTGSCGLTREIVIMSKSSKFPTDHHVRLAVAERRSYKRLDHAIEKLREVATLARRSKCPSTDFRRDRA